MALSRARPGVANAVTPERYQRIGDVFEQALERPPGGRQAFLDEVCGDDVELRDEVESLLREDAAVPDEFLAGPLMPAMSKLVQAEAERVETVTSGKAPEPDPRAGALVAGRYRLRETLGVGGMGRVYLAEDLSLGRLVALKTCERDGHRRRFDAETRILAQLDHPEIVTLHDLGRAEDGVPYCALRYVRGQTLKSVIEMLKAGDEAAKRYSLSRLMQIFMQVCQAISYAHDRGVIHRDLKPDNIMLGEHGEVQVLDWGLAKVLDDADPELAGADHDTTSGTILGTLTYMAPEQALGQNVDRSADVFALGLILYELLTLTRPFRRRTQIEVLQALLHPPQSPRDRAPNRAIPASLEETCLWAMANDPEHRLPGAGALAESVQSWLDESSDRERRHARAEERADEAEQLIERYSELDAELARLEQSAAAVESRLPPWRPAAEKAELVAARAAVRVARRRLTDLGADLVEAGTKALEQDEDNLRARQVLARFYYDRFVRAERDGDEEGAARLERFIVRYHNGRYATELTGDGSLVLGSTPAAAEAVLYPLIEEGFARVPGEGRNLGKTPLVSSAVRMGSYLAVLRAPGCHYARYPVAIARNRDWIGDVKLFASGEIVPGFVHVPAGSFRYGGDPIAGGTPLPRSERHIGDYLIGQFPVTMAEYLEFLTELTRRDGVEAAKARSPRYKGNEANSTYLIEVDGTLELPELDADGEPWDPRRPVVAIRADDAEAYCEWRSQRDRQVFALPTEEEWEKAARGVDGRWFPWGWDFDPSLCNMKSSRRDRPMPVAVDEFATDVSIYGVSGLAGNVQEWTATVLTATSDEDGRSERVCRGGSWHRTASWSRCAARRTLMPTQLADDIGFRLVVRPPAEEDELLFSG